MYTAIIVAGFAESCRNAGVGAKLRTVSNTATADAAATPRAASSPAAGQGGK
jgi:hypothetical protein